MWRHNETTLLPQLALLAPKLQDKFVSNNDHAQECSTSVLLLTLPSSSQSWTSTNKFSAGAQAHVLQMYNGSPSVQMKLEAPPHSNLDNGSCAWSAPPIGKISGVLWLHVVLILIGCIYPTFSETDHWFLVLLLRSSLCKHVDAGTVGCSWGQTCNGA